MSPTPCPACRRVPAGGMTLLEVVVATAIFSVTVATLLIVRNRAIDQTGTAKNRRIARRLAMQILEEIHGGKDYEQGAGEAFDEQHYPGFSWRVKDVEVMELEEPELAFLKDPKKKPGSPPGGRKPPAGREPGREPGGGAGGLGGMLGGGPAAEELKRYVVEIQYPARTEEGLKTLEVVTYVLKEGDAEALAKAFGGAFGGAAAGGASERMPGGTGR